MADWDVIPIGSIEHKLARIAAGEGTEAYRRVQIETLGASDRIREFEDRE